MLFSVPRVVSWEPVPHFVAFFQFGIALNGLGHLIDLHETVVGDMTGQSLELVIPQRGIWGTASVGGLNIDK